jgi:hypothetical protein
VRRRARVIVGIVAAAVLSVITIPVIAALSNKGLAEGSNIAAIGGFVIALIAFAVTTVAYWIDRPKNEVPTKEYSAELLLLHELGTIEREASILLGEEHKVSVIRLRSRLHELGIWSDSDIYDFDLALRTRNKIAHGDLEELNKASVLEATETMRRLRQKVEANQLGEPT